MKTKLVIGFVVAFVTNFILMVADAVMHARYPGGKNPVYREGEAKKAWQDVDKFFAKTLQGK